MRYIHGIFVVNRPDLLKLAVQSVKCLWPHAFILDNSPGGHIGMEHKWPIPVVRPNVPLSTAQGMNFMYRMAREQGADAFGYQHNDAEAGKGSARKYLKVVKDAFSRGRKWATVFTYYDLIAGYNVRAVDEIGEWDTHFPQPTYHFDVDWFHRARLCGYELIESGVPMTHHNGESNTIKSDDHWQRLNALKFPMNETYYLAKWGGPTHAEKFATPWDEKAALENSE